MLKISTVTLVFSQSVMAIDYVPPPTGPYQSQSTIIINNNENHPSTPAQVYVFPSDSLINAGNGGNSVAAKQNDKQFSGPDISPDKALTPVPGEPIEKPPIVPENNRPTAPIMDTYMNPWSPESLPGTNYNQADYYQPNWNNQQYNYPPQYSYPQQYPYGYNNNQNNFMNNPFNSMPSPWSAMPMQPFFSGRK